MKSLVLGKVRIQALTRDIIRIEYDKGGVFEDSPTFFIPDRNISSDDIDIDVIENAEKKVVTIGELTLVIPDGEKSLKGTTLSCNGKEVYKYRAMNNCGELPSVGKTPYVFQVVDSPRIICPAHGYSAIGAAAERYEIKKRVADVYLLVCRKDAKKLRRLFVELTGRNEMVRLATLGSWNSRYYKYNQQEAEEMIARYREKNVPLDNMVIDTDWRAASERGIGYDINTELFPDLKGFFDYAHKNNVEIMFNDHPEPQDGAESLLDPKEIAFREKKLQEIMSLGLDTWWFDRNWHTALKSPVKSILPETLGMYLFTDITKNYYANRSENKLIHRRPVIMANVNDVHNGTYRKIHDTASHRYSIQWTGDIGCQNEDLLQEIRNLVRCTDNCIPYVNFDCGGHVGDPDKEIYLRWMKFGAFSPILRPHCTISVKKYREPWNYDEETLSVVREYINMRYRLLPTVYRLAHDNYISGEPIYKSMGFVYPQDKSSLRCNKQYMLGDDILVAPVYAEPLTIVPRSAFVSPIVATYYSGCNLEGEPVAVKKYSYINQEYDKTTPVKELGPYNYSAVFEFKLKFNSDVEIYINNDDGTRFYVDGELVLDDWKFHYAFPQRVVALKKGIEYNVRMDYMQGGDKAIVKLLYRKIAEEPSFDNLERKPSFYIPEDGYTDVFNGRRYSAGRHTAKYGVKNYPIFVRKGSLLLLGKDALNTHEQSWRNLAIDMYPSKEREVSSYLYEDDRETTAYKYGEYRTQRYGMKYDREDNAIKVLIEPVKGAYCPSETFDDREVVLRYHMSAMPDKIVGVTVNGEERPYETIDRDIEAYPFAFEGGTPDGDIVSVRVAVPLNATTEISFKLA